ncbi:MAG: Hpt domain-containing protein [Gemmatimonadetes bacterium]|nr:Hpt domain-containing protein [Gemmatimonadota bacterium]
MSVIDAVVLGRLQQEHDAEVLGAVIDLFVEDVPVLLTALDAALAAGDVEAFRRHAHTMKSNADTFGATTLAALARELEEIARTGSLRVDDRLAPLGAASREAVEALQRLHP